MDVNPEPCPAAGVPCPRVECLGKSDPSFCGWYAQLAAWLSKTEAEQFAWLAAAEGLATASPATQASRLAICAGDAEQPRCDQYDAAADRCGQCGCSLLDRRLLAAGACPLGKW